MIGPLNGQGAWVANGSASSMRQAIVDSAMATGTVATAANYGSKEPIAIPAHFRLSGQVRNLFPNTTADTLDFVFEAGTSNQVTLHFEDALGGPAAMQIDTPAGGSAAGITLSTGVWTDFSIELNGVHFICKLGGVVIIEDDLGSAPDFASVDTLLLKIVQTTTAQVWKFRQLVLGT